MEMIEEEQVFKGIKQDRISKQLPNKYKFMKSHECKYEAQSISQLNLQNFVGCSSEGQSTLNSTVGESSSSTYLEDKKNQLFKKYSCGTPKKSCYKFSTKFKNLICKAESLKNQIKDDKIIFNKPRSQEQNGNRLAKERNISGSVSKIRHQNSHELTPKDFQSSTTIQSQKYSLYIKSQTLRSTEVNKYKQLQTILNKKQMELSFLKSNEDKSNPIRKQIRQRVLIVRTVTYIIFAVIFGCIKIALDNFF